MKRVPMKRLPDRPPDRADEPPRYREPVAYREPVREPVPVVDPKHYREPKPYLFRPPPVRIRLPRDPPVADPPVTAEHAFIDDLTILLGGNASRAKGAMRSIVDRARCSRRRFTRYELIDIETYG